MESSQLIFWTLSTGILSALATGLGAIPVHFVKSNSTILRSFASAIAAGMMISASVFSLAEEGLALKHKFPVAPYILIAGLLLGAAFFYYTEKHFSHPHIDQFYLSKGITKRGFLIFMAMFVHSIPEGIALGVSFATGNLSFGIIMALAITVHNIPEGIAISLPLKKDGVSTKNCVLISIMSSVPQPVMALPSAFLAWIFEPLLPIGLGFAGGAMIYLVITELIPDALEGSSKNLTAWGVMIGLSGMLLITTLLNEISF